MVKIWLGRPSGHSIYFTLVGTFETEDKAASAFKKCVKKYGDSHVRQKKCEIQIDAEEVWSEDELSSDERRLENYGAVEVEAIENFWDFEVALCLDAPSASEQDLEVLLLLKYPELAKYLEYLDKWVEHAVDGKTTKYHLAYRGSSNDITDDVDMSFLFYHGGKEVHEFLGRKIGTDEIPECELLSCC